MPKLNSRAGTSYHPTHDSPSTKWLAIMPALAIFYILLILPFFPDDGKGRIENILFWPILALLVVMLVAQNASQIDYRFFRSVPIASLIAYLVFAAASVTWAFSPGFAFSRLVVQVLALIVVVAPYVLPARGRQAIPGVYLCYVLALALSAVFVLTTPPSPIGHPGYFTHKQELGLLAAIGIILSSYEFFLGGWRRIVAPVMIVLAFWLVIRERIEKRGSVCDHRADCFMADAVRLQKNPADASLHRRRRRGRVDVCVQSDRAVGIQDVRRRHSHRPHRDMVVYRLSDIAQILVRLGIPFVLLRTEFAPE